MGSDPIALRLVTPMRQGAAYPLGASPNRESNRMRRSEQLGIFKSKGVPLSRRPNAVAAPLLWPADELSLGVMGRKSGL